MKLSQVAHLLQQAGISWESAIVQISRDAKHTTPALQLTIPNPNHHIDLRLVFRDASEDPEFDDLEFGDYFFELFDCQKEYLHQELMQDIQNVISGQLHLIVGTSGNAAFQCAFLDAPEEELNDMDSYHKQLAKIQKPKSLWKKPFGKRWKYEIFNWTAYRVITK